LRLSEYRQRRSGVGGGEDVGRKAGDTAVGARGAVALRIDAIAVTGSDTTDTPETVHQLSIRSGWLESGSVG
jgi:hypothetical protein